MQGLDLGLFGVGAQLCISSYLLLETHLLWGIQLNKLRSNQNDLNITKEPVWGLESEALWLSYSLAVSLFSWEDFLH